MSHSNTAQRRTALVTGTTSGIGEELTNVLAATGHDLVLVSQNAARLAEQRARLRERHGVDVHVIANDLAAPGAAAAVHGELRRAGIRVDVLVNNAGFNVSGPFAETSLEDESRMMQLHVLFLTQLTKLLLPAMVERGDGRILNVGSTGSFSPVPLDAVYAATKAFVLSFSSAIRAELRGTGVTVSTLCPGATNTPFARKAGIQNTLLFKYFVMEPRDVARIAYDGMMAGKKVIVPGLLNALLVWLMPVTPAPLLDAVSKTLLTRRGTRAA
jgi:short-subunit dehydrogenase